MQMTIDARVHCEHEAGCSESFLVRIPLAALLARLPIEPELPRGWSLQAVSNHAHVSLSRTWRMSLGLEATNPVQAFCPKHCPETPGYVSDVEDDAEGRGTIEPTPEIIERARRLQALAMDRGAAEGERRNAWDQFGKLWAKYRLPVDLGLEQL